MVFTNRKICDDAMQKLAGYLVERLSSSIYSDSSVNRAMPDLRTDEGLMPDFQENFRQHREDFVNITPNLNPNQLGIVGFDIRQGRIVAESDTVMDRVTSIDLLDMKPRILDIGEPYVFQADPDGEKVYYVTSFEKIRLSTGLEMLIDSKSTTARLGCLTHEVGVTEEGEIITAVQPFSFPIKVECGKTTLSQAVVRYANSPFMTGEEILHENQVKFEFNKRGFGYFLTSFGFQMQFDTSGFAYRAKPFHKDMPAIEMDANGLDWEEYFELIELTKGNSEIRPEKKRLYLMGSRGVIETGAVCGFISREQGVLTGTGAWSHLAGIIHPFWRGQITMEFYSHEKRRILNGSGAGYVRFDRIQGDVSKPKYNGNYQEQKAPMLPKMFRAHKNL